MTRPYRHFADHWVFYQHLSGPHLRRRHYALLLRSAGPQGGVRHRVDDAGRRHDSARVRARTARRANCRHCGRRALARSRCAFRVARELRSGVVLRRGASLALARLPVRRAGRADTIWTPLLATGPARGVTGRPMARALHRWPLRPYWPTLPASTCRARFPRSTAARDATCSSRTAT